MGFQYHDQPTAHAQADTRRTSVLFWVVVFTAATWAVSLLTISILGQSTGQLVLALVREPSSSHRYSTSIFLQQIRNICVVCQACCLFGYRLVLRPFADAAVVTAEQALNSTRILLLEFLRLLADAEDHLQAI